MLLKNHFKDTKISTKFNSLLILGFVISIAMSGIALSSALEQRAQDEVTSQALLLIQTMNSLRNYTQDRVFPLLEHRLETESAFIPEAIPTYSLREVFENLRKNEAYKNFLYKDATLNPTNLQDKADSFEVELINRFRKEPETKEISGFRMLPKGEFFYVAKPLIITDPSCLQCHSTPKAAPKSLLATYGANNGFGWKLNEPITTQVVSVPSQAVFAEARRSFSIVMGILVGTFLTVILLINSLLKKTVIQRISKIARTAQAVSIGEMNANFEESSKDEIGALATAFNRMRDSLAIAMDMLKHQRS
ncbi:MAG: DUF3365 domain-containing protein [Chroococcidiopsidaceae cyanobacterium CP_BM_RX_35]|nr:DUF3365 domain-containing protein [Chroococcidiopsidaceae cyanobacterium CP_BM_RX_35]